MAAGMRVNIRKTRLRTNSLEDSLPDVASRSLRRRGEVERTRTMRLVTKALGWCQHVVQSRIATYAQLTESTHQARTNASVATFRAAH
jgi:hypothetical protein